MRNRESQWMGLREKLERLSSNSRFVYPLGVLLSVILTLVYIFVVGAAVYECIGVRSSERPPRVQHMALAAYIGTGLASLVFATVSTAAVIGFARRRWWATILFVLSLCLIAQWVAPNPVTGLLWQVYYQMVLRSLG